jgi:acyl-coenzyme A thioesterase PaaI-like protein
MTTFPLDATGAIDIEAIFANAPGFLRTLGPTLVSVDDQQSVLRLAAGPELHNHVGGPHAAVLFGLGELAAFALLLKVFRDEVTSGGVPFIKNGEISYQALVTEPVLATARITDDVEAVRARYAEKGSVSFGCEVVFTVEGSGQQTTVMRPTMTLKRF